VFFQNLACPQKWKIFQKKKKNVYKIDYRWISSHKIFVVHYYKKGHKQSKKKEFKVSQNSADSEPIAHLLPKGSLRKAICSTSTCGEILVRSEPMDRIREAVEFDLVNNALETRICDPTGGDIYVFNVEGYRAWENHLMKDNLRWRKQKSSTSSHGYIKTRWIVLNQGPILYKDILARNFDAVRKRLTFSYFLN